MRILSGYIQKLRFGRGQVPYVLQGHAILVGADADNFDFRLYNSLFPKDLGLHSRKGHLGPAHPTAF